MNMAYARITTGEVFDICEAWLKKKAIVEADIASLNAAVGATFGRSLRAGAFLLGFHFAPGTHPTGWRQAGKKYPGYYKPDKRSPAGAARLAQLAAIRIPVDEDLAHDLGLDPFFHDLEGHWCSSVYCLWRGGVIYAAYPARFSHTLTVRPGVEPIPEWEYLKAQA